MQHHPKSIMPQAYHPSDNRSSGKSIIYSRIFSDSEIASNFYQDFVIGVNHADPSISVSLISCKDVECKRGLKSELCFEITRNDIRNIDHRDFQKFNSIMNNAAKRAPSRNRTNKDKALPPSPNDSRKSEVDNNKTRWNLTKAIEKAKDSPSFVTLFPFVTTLIFSGVVIIAVLTGLTRVSPDSSPNSPPPKVIPRGQESS